MFRFKFDPNRNKIEKFDIFEYRGEGVGKEFYTFIYKILISIILGKHKNVFFLQISSKLHHK